MSEIDKNFKDYDKQPNIIIATLGNPANGKTSLLKKLTGLNVMRFKKEAVNNMTIKLGYTNAKIVKCPKCPKPYCYQINNKECEQCETETDLCLHISFVDAPGHTELQSTALSGANNMDYCLLLISTDNELETNNKNDNNDILYINEHYKLIKLLNLEKNTVIIQNKIDLVSKEIAKSQYKFIKNKYDIDCIIPISAQFGYNTNYILQYLVEKIPSPITITKCGPNDDTTVVMDNKLSEKISKPLKMCIIRSFDVNKPGTIISDLQGAVAGGTIKEGKIKIGDRIKILPGIIHDNKTMPLICTVCSLKTDDNILQEAYPGGLIGVGLSLDPSLSKEDRLVGNIIVNEDNNIIKCFIKAKIHYEYYDTNETFKLKESETYNLMLYTMKRIIKISEINIINNELLIESSLLMAGEVNDNVVISQNNKILLFGKIIEIL